MQQIPQKHFLANAVGPEPLALPEDPGGIPAAADEPEQMIGPEDEAVVVERLRELGYIE
jgi:hypothetical protein